MGISVHPTATTVDRIRIIHGSAVANELIALEVENERWGFKSNGYISNANHHAKKLTLLLFINHRSVESSTIKKAVEQTYSTFLPKGSHPFAYLSLEIEPARVDVNVHPTKREVNFLNEDEIVDIICEEIRSSLGKVDTSRTFVTQSLLPGVRVPTISSTPLSGPSKIPPALSRTPSTSASRHPAPEPRIYENNLVRTDSKLRKITSMLPPSTGRPSCPQPVLASGSVAPTEDIYTLDPSRHATLCRLQSIRDLRAAVLASQHTTLTDMLAAHTFVGIVDDTRRIAAVQSGVKLLLIDYAALSFAHFYQLGLTDFGNFGRITLVPPLPLYDVLLQGASSDDSIDDDDDPPDWPAVALAVQETLLTRRDMLAEYFSLELSADGTQLLTLPLLLKGYLPSMGKLPRFLLRLGPCVDWTDEKRCFHSFLTELASWYVPEALPPPPPLSPPAPTITQQNQQAAGNGDAVPDVAAGEEDDENADSAAAPSAEESTRVAARRHHIHRALETTLFPAFAARLVATRDMLPSVFEVADLKGLYRVFERC